MLADRRVLLPRERHEGFLDGVLRERVVAQQTGGEAKERSFVLGNNFIQRDFQIF